MAFEAIDPTTGLPVAGVVIDAAAIFGDDGQGNESEPIIIPPTTTPLFAPTPTVGE